MARRKDLTLDEKELLYHLLDEGLSYKEVANEIGCSRSTVNRYVSAREDNIYNLTDFFGKVAKEKGFTSYREYQNATLLYRNPDRTSIIVPSKERIKQTKFEKSMQSIYDSSVIWKEPSEEFGELLEVKDMVGMAMNYLADKHPKYHKIIFDRFFEFKTLEEVGNEWSVSRERIRQLEKKAFNKIKWYVVKKRFFD